MTQGGEQSGGAGTGFETEGDFSAADDASVLDEQQEGSTNSPLESGMSLSDLGPPEEGWTRLIWLDEFGEVRSVTSVPTDPMDGDGADKIFWPKQDGSGDSN